jgi:hypothetical protein
VKAWLPVSLAAFFLCAAYPIHNPDVFWHLAIGRAQWDQKAPLRSEPLSILSYPQTHPGMSLGITSAQPGEPLPWLGFEWLSELFYYLLWAAAGAWGLIVFKALMAVGTGFISDHNLARRGVGVAWRAAALLGLAWVSQTRWMVEPEIFTFLYIAGLLAFLRASKEPFSPRNQLVAAAFFCLWANLHGGFIYGVSIYVLHLFFSKQRPSVKVQAAMAVVAGTLINPYGWRAYEVPFFLLANFGKLHVGNVEWGAPVLLKNSGLPMFAAIVLSGLGAASYLNRRGKKLDIAGLACLSLFGLWGCLSYRNLSVASIVVVPLSAAWMSEAFDLKRAPRWSGLALTACLALGWLSLARNALALGSPAQGVVWPVYQRGVVEMIARQPWSGPVLIPHHWAAYPAWRLYPQRRVFAYGRLDVFRERLFEYQNAKSNPEVWRSFLDRYGIEAVVEPYPKVYFDGELIDARSRKTTRVLRSPLVPYLPREQWALVYWDDQALLFVRRGTPIANEYRLLDPTDIPYLSALKERGWLNQGLLAAERRRHESEVGPSRFDTALDILMKASTGGLPFHDLH